MTHDKFDLERWKAMFPLSRLRKQAADTVLNWQRENPGHYANDSSVDKRIALLQPGGEMITSPVHLAAVEQLREEAGAEKRLTDYAPTDVFVWGKGEPARRDVTKVGGLPYWPASKSWPRDKWRNPMAFVAQFCFADSRDIVGELPGDVLLMFAHEDALSGDVEDAGLWHFAWESLGQTDLIQAEQIPRANWNFPIIPCYGEIYRTRDYLDAGETFAPYKQPWLLGVLQAVKIGGYPGWIQEEEPMAGTFLCALGSIGPEHNSPYPFLNVAEPLASSDYDNGLLGWGDAGSLYIFLDDAQTARAVMQSY